MTSKHPGSIQDKEDDEKKRILARKRKQQRGGGAGINPIDMLKDLAGVTFDNRESTEKFKEKFGAFLHQASSSTSKTSKTPNVLHELAAKNDDRKDQDWPERRVAEALGWFLDNYPGLLNKIDEKDMTPFHLALECANDGFVETVLSHPNSKIIDQVLPQSSQNGNCLHLAIRYLGSYNFDMVGLLIKKCKDLPKLFTESSTGFQLTPLHLALALDVSPVESNIVSTLKKHGFWKQGTLNKEADGESLKPIKRTTTWKALDDPHSGSPATEEEQDENRLLNDVVKDLILASKASLQCVDTKGKTPYRFRKSFLKNNGTVQNLLQNVRPEDRKLAFRKIFVEDSMAAFIRRHCMEELSRDEIMRCLYRPGKERHIEFDLAGLPNPTITQGYLQGLSKHLRFESILKYVALPRLTVEAPKRVPRTASASPPTQDGRTDMKIIFEWLRENGVQTIVKVMVIDDGVPSHSDSAIEKALGGFDVQVWDWKKVDICSEAICNSTKVVKEISLYSSGNNAVLMGWASPDGFINRDKFPKLKKVNVFMRWENETPARLKSNLDAFTKSLERRSDQDGEPLKVAGYPDDMAVSYVSEFSNTEGYLERNNPWIKCLEDFATFIYHAPAIEPVKIAIIDDGVDASLASLNGKIAGGKSFCRHPNSDDLMSAYFAPSGMHGTWMATMITKLCPHVSLYIARLEEYPSIQGDGRRQITAESAAQAIRWAVACKVDMISISWTIEATSPDSKEIKDLIAAIASAESSNILVFCSASDQGSTSKEICYPASAGHCIRIGGANSSGRALTWVREDLVDFLFPGHNIAFDTHKGSPVTYESGSSIATAAASGLAGLLLCCSRLVDPENSTFFKSERNMKNAFNALTVKNQGYSALRQRDLYPDVERYFGTMFKNLLLEHMPKAERPVKGSPITISEVMWNDSSKKALLKLVEHIKGSSMY